MEWTHNQERNLSNMREMKSSRNVSEMDVRVAYKVRSNHICAGKQGNMEWMVQGEYQDQNNTG